ncbi:ATP-binding protein [Herbivorax sp. ANBcel31]|uniref:AAA family ATPase n=1 Tax=Herbivorax sp. ANBcel31 TaxID=3069754 RepID=UPI0027AF8C14|nr:ATP-binding protein [Herbivorax sp. ANBcel31]MDQ2088054.1 ATP-binding protein [Herbivorax sp. ANBcel31]
MIIMLIGFSCKNYASYYDQATLSIISSTKDEFKDLNTFDTSFDRLLKSVLIYGANGSGKSNIIKAMSFMKNMVNMSFTNEDIITECEKFKFNIEAESQPSMFEIVFVVGDTLYKYGFEIMKKVIHKEWLYKKTNRIVPVFIRESSDYSSISLKGELKKEAEIIKSHTRENALFISTAAMFNIKIAKVIKDWFENSLCIISPDYSSPGTTIEYLETGDERKAEVLSFLKKADFNIEDFDLDAQEEDLDHLDNLEIELINRKFFKSKIPKEKLNNIKKRIIDLKTKHFIYNNKKENVTDINLPFLKYQSHGTIKFFELSGPILEALKKGKTLIIDEIDSRLHCAILRYILSLFNSIDKNLFNAQLICSTHDVLLLEENIRRDQIWFVDKNEYGESELYSLDEFKDIRKNDPLLKKYLLGVFGAVPFIKEG